MTTLDSLQYKISPFIQNYFWEFTLAENIEVLQKITTVILQYSLKIIAGISGFDNWQSLYRSVLGSIPYLANKCREKWFWFFFFFNVSCFFSFFLWNRKLFWGNKQFSELVQAALNNCFPSLNLELKHFFFF